MDDWEDIQGSNSTQQDRRPIVVPQGRGTKELTTNSIGLHLSSLEHSFGLWIGRQHCQALGCLERKVFKVVGIQHRRQMRPVLRG